MGCKYKDTSVVFPLKTRWLLFFTCLIQLGGGGNTPLGLMTCDWFIPVKFVEATATENWYGILIIDKPEKKQANKQKTHQWSYQFPFGEDGVAQIELVRCGGSSLISHPHMHRLILSSVLLIQDFLTAFRLPSNNCFFCFAGLPALQNRGHTEMTFPPSFLPVHNTDGGETSQSPADLPKSQEESTPLEHGHSGTPLPAAADQLLRPQGGAVTTGNDLEAVPVDTGIRGDYLQGPESQTGDTEEGFSGTENVTPTMGHMPSSPDHQEPEPTPEEGSGESHEDVQGSPEKSVRFVEAASEPQQHLPGAAQEPAEWDIMQLQLPGEDAILKPAGRRSSEELAELKGEGAITLPAQDVPSPTPENVYPQVARLISGEPNSWLWAHDSQDATETVTDMRLKEVEEKVSAVPAGVSAHTEHLDSSEPNGTWEVATETMDNHLEARAVDHSRKLVGGTLFESVSMIAQDGVTTRTPAFSTAVWPSPEKDELDLTWEAGRKEDPTTPWSLSDVGVPLPSPTGSDPPHFREAMDLSTLVSVPSSGPSIPPSEEAQRGIEGSLPTGPGERRAFLPVESDSGSGEEKRETLTQAEDVESLAWLEEANTSLLGKCL